MNQATQIPTVTYTHCNICVAGCGLAVTTQANKVVKIEPDKDNHFWRDFCIRAAQSHLLIDHPLRITAPMKRVGDKFVEVSYEQMLAELSGQLNTLIDDFGPDSIGSYIGNPGVSNFGTYAFLNLFLDAIQTNNRYFVGSIDQNGQHIVNEMMFNHPWAFLQPDVDRCRYLMMIGANPAISEFGWLYSVSNGWKRALSAKKDGAHLVLVDPRKTESAKKATLHIAPLPDTDWAFLMAVIHLILANDWHHQDAIADLSGFDEFKSLMLSADPASLSQRCDVPLDTIKQVAHDFSHSSSAACVANTGVGQSSTGTVSLWLANALSLITGNMRREGGIFHNRGSMNLLKNGAELFPVSDNESRLRKTKSVAGHFHVNEIADEINTPGEGQIKAFFMVAGNPVISGPEGNKLNEALKKLDLLICVDLFQRESHQHADWLIPGTHFLELNEPALLLKDINATASAQIIRRAVDKPDTMRYEWEFFRDLTLKMGKPLLLGKKYLNPVVKLFNLYGRFSKEPYNGFSPKTLAAALLKKGGATTYKALEDAEHGLLLDESIDINYFLDNLPTSDGKVALLPPRLQTRLIELLDKPVVRDDIKDFPLQLINRRRKHMMNSWLTQGAMQKMPKREGDIVEVNPEDAARFGVNDGATVRVTSSAGELEAKLRVNDEVRRGVVVMGHGWGGRTFDPKDPSNHQASDGVNRNLLVSAAKSEMDPISGIPKLNGTAVRITPV